MKTFYSIEEMKRYYVGVLNSYVFTDKDGFGLDIEIAFSLDVQSHIFAGDILAQDITALSIHAREISAKNIKSANIDVININADDIDALNIFVGLRSITGDAINNINARNIKYYGVCFAYNNITCSSIKGERENAKHFVLDGEIIIKKEEKKPVTLELTDEQLAKIKTILEEEK